MLAKILTQKRLKEVLRYNPDTGIFTWVKDSVNKVKKGDVAGCDKDGYIVIRINSVLYRAHRLAHLYMTESWPKEEIDHINHVRADNRWSNIREVTHGENGRNVSMRKNNKSGYTGVHFRKDTKKWLANIMVNGKTINIGHYKKLSDAINARKKAEHKYNFHNNHGTLEASNEY